ncbi:MAG: hypothetical protein ABIB71_00925 [Candidatus Woesearchaeota archaeon]
MGKSIKKGEHHEPLKKVAVLIVLFFIFIILVSTAAAFFGFFEPKETSETTFVAKLSKIPILKSIFRTRPAMESCLYDYNCIENNVRTADYCKEGKCFHEPIISCFSGDSFCPESCTPFQDIDCWECSSEMYNYCLDEGFNDRFCKLKACPKNPLSGEARLKRGSFAVVYPSGFAPLAGKLIEVNIESQANISSFLGIEPGSDMITRFILLEDAEYGDRPGTTIVGNDSVQPISGSIEYFEDLQNGYLRCGIDQECMNDHEMTHMIVARTPIPTWLNEGLAMFVEQRIGFAAITTPIMCTSTGWYYKSYYGQERGPDTEEPYVNLSSVERGSEEESGAYKTAYCFWDYMENTYGHDSVVRVLQRLESFRASPGRYSFFGRIARPVIGSSIEGVALSRFGIGPGTRGDVVYLCEDSKLVSDYSGCLPA